MVEPSQLPQESMSNRAARESQGVPDLHQILDYKPLRSDFTHEYDAEADNLLMDLDFQYESDDNPEEIRFLDEAVELFN